MGPAIAVLFSFRGPGRSEEMSESLISLTKNEQMSEPLIFLSESLIHSFLDKNERFARKTDERIPSPGYTAKKDISVYQWLTKN